MSLQTNIMAYERGFYDLFKVSIRFIFCSRDVLRTYRLYLAEPPVPGMPEYAECEA